MKLNSTFSSNDSNWFRVNDKYLRVQHTLRYTKQQAQGFLRQFRVSIPTKSVCMDMNETTAVNSPSTRIYFPIGKKFCMINGIEGKLTSSIGPAQQPSYNKCCSSAVDTLKPWVRTWSGLNLFVQWKYQEDTSISRHVGHFTSDYVWVVLYHNVFFTRL